MARKSSPGRLEPADRIQPCRRFGDVISPRLTTGVVEEEEITLKCSPLLPIKHIRLVDLTNAIKEIQTDSMTRTVRAPVTRSYVTKQNLHLSDQLHIWMFGLGLAPGVRVSSQG